MIDGELAWAIVAYYVLLNGRFSSVTGIVYKAYLSGDLVYYSGGNRNDGEEETISKEEFMAAFNSVCGLDLINTNTIKDFIPNSLYRKRTPFIGLLASAYILR